MEIILIAATAKNFTIGLDGKIPWRIKEDLARFQRLTVDHTCVMGRKTWESLPMRPLPLRRNIVLTRSRAEFEGAEKISRIEDILSVCAGESKVFVIGGAQVYAAAMDLADTIELTRIHSEWGGDVFFPEIDETKWTVHAMEEHEEYSFVTYHKLDRARRR